MNTTLKGLKSWRLGTLLAVGLALSLGTASAGSSSTSLPNGANLQVSIDDPVTSTEFLVPTDASSRDIDVSGTASVGLGEPDATFAYVVDVSGSTDVGSGTGCAPVLDCEKQFVTALNQAAIADGSVDEVGVVVYATSAVTADLSPDPGDQTIVAPDADGHLATVVNSAFSSSVGDGGVAQFTNKLVGIQTNCTGALEKTLDVVTASTNSVNIVVFVSDGLCDDSGGGGLAAFNAAIAALASEGAVVHTIASGAGSSCTDSEPGFSGTLQDIATGTGGQCFVQTDPGQLPSIIPDLISSSLDSLQVGVDGGGPTTIPNSDISLPLPQPGAVSVTYDTPVLALVPGNHQICVTANGSDAAGSASVTQCELIHLLQISLEPDGAVNELGTPGQTHTVTATIAGPPAGETGSVESRLVEFDVIAGPNTGAAGSALTDAGGQASFTYAATQGLGGLGTDTIRACFTLNDPTGETGCDEVTKQWVDTTPPEVSCPETTNPHGRNVPPAGRTTLPGPRGGQNEAGFYELVAVDAVDPNPVVFAVDLGSGTVFGPFASGVKIKYTQAPGAAPRSQPIGSQNGQAGAVSAHIIGKGDLAVFAVDASGNVSARTVCLVPPPPK